jgi:hypothetical protein
MLLLYRHANAGWHYGTEYEGLLSSPYLLTGHRTLTFYSLLENVILEMKYCSCIS